MGTKTIAVLLSLLEKAGTSAGEQFLTVCLAGGVFLNLAGLPWELGLATAAGAFVLSFATSALTALVGLNHLSYWPELGRRVTVTFLQSFLSMLGAGVVDVTHVHWVVDLNIAAVAAFMAFAKGLLSPNARDRLSPSLLHEQHVIALEALAHD